MAKADITRRAFVKATTAFIGTAATGLASMSLWGCSDEGASGTDADSSVESEGLPQADVNLSIQDSAFSINGGEAIEFTTEKLSILPLVSQGIIELCYTDTKGEESFVKLGELGDSVSVHGKLGMLTADGTKDSSSLVVGEDADLDVLSLGSIGRADVQGEVDCLIVVGDSGVKIHPGGMVEHMVTNPYVGTIEKSEGATIQNAWSPDNVVSQGLSQVVEDAEQIVHERHAVTTNSHCLEVFADDDPENNASWRDMLEDSVQSEDGQVDAAAGIMSLFAPKVALAQESSSDVNSGSLDDDQDADPDADPDTDASQDSVEDEDPLADPYIEEGDEVDFIVDPDDDSYVVDELPDGVDVPYKPEIDDDEVAALLPDDVTAIAVPLAEDDDGLGFGEDILMEALAKIAEAGLEAIGEHLADKGWEAVFPDETAEALEQIQAALADIKKKVDAIYAILVKRVYSDQIDEYLNSWTTKPDTWLLNHKKNMESIDAEGDDQRAEDRKKLALRLLQDTPPTDDLVDGDTIVVATENLASAILKVYATTSLNLLEVYNALMPFTYKWEHQAYDARESFQSYVMGQLAAMAAWSKFALAINIKNTEDRDKKAKWQAQWDALFQDGSAGDSDLASEQVYQDTISQVLADPAEEKGLYVQVLEMFKGTDDNPGLVVVRRDESQRYYQVPEHEMLLAAQIATVATQQSAKNRQDQLLKDSAGHRVVTKEQLGWLLSDYGSGKTLDDILYDEAEGNFGKPDNWMHWRYITDQEWKEVARLPSYEEGYHYETYAEFTKYDGSRCQQLVYWWKRVWGGKEAHLIDTNFNCLYVIDESNQ